VLWSSSGKAKVLEDAGGVGASQPVAINASGQSVGWSYTKNGGGLGLSLADAVLWSPSGKATVLQDVGGVHDSYSIAINDAGQSVGYSFTNGGIDAVLWSPSGKATVLQDAGGRGHSEALAINDAGWSIGYSGYSGDAVLWSPSGKATVLPSVGGFHDTYAIAINDAGQSVGYSRSRNGSDAVLWSPSGKATDLGALLGSAWSDTEAAGINNSGDIIGYGDYRGRQYGFLLAPDSGSLLSAGAVPEPSTWAMMLAGFAGLSFAGYRPTRTATRALRLGTGGRRAGFTSGRTAPPHIPN
jgi:probable HAF family extracellular repeat protein